MRLRRYTIYSFVVFLLTSLSPSSAYCLDFRNAHPLMLGLPGPVLAAPSFAQGAEASLTYASSYIVETSPSWHVGIDVESLIVDMSYSVEVGDGTMLTATLPVVGHFAGSLDSALGAYHDALGVRDYGRSDRGRNEFLLDVTHAGRTLIRGRDGEFGPGDASVSITQSLGQGAWARVWMSLPTAEPGRGYGNASLSGGLMAGATFNSTGPWGMDALIGVAAPGALRGIDEDAGLREFPFGAATLSYRHCARTQLSVGLMAGGGAYAMGLRKTDAAWVVLGVGVDYKLASGGAIAIEFMEDVNTASAPDVTLSVKFKR